MDKREVCIATPQVFTFVAMTMGGYRLLSLPNEVAQVARQDGWLTVLIAGLLTTGSTYLFARYMLRFRGYHWPETLDLVYGKWLGRPLNVVVILILLAHGGFNMTEFSTTLRVVVLDRTPPWAIWVAMLAVTTYAVYLGIEAMARLYDLLFFGSTLLGWLILMLALQTLQLEHILPVLGIGPWALLRGIWVSLRAYVDFAVVGLLVPYARDTRSYTKMIVYSLLYVTLVNSLVVFQCLAAFGVGETIYQYVPTMILAKSISIRVILLERLELILMTVWVAVAFTTIASYQLVVAVIIKVYWRLHERWYATVSVACGLAIGLTAAIAPDVATNEHLLELFDTVAVVLAYGFVPFTYLVAIVRKKRGKPNGQPAYKGCVSQS